MTTKVTGSVLADTAVTPGTYGGTQTVPAFTVDAQGRITYAANITSGVITAGTRGQGADIIVPTIQYNALGQIVAGTNTTIRTATTSVTGVVQLADSVSNTSTTAAATARAVKAAYDAAGANATTALSSAQANTGAGLIIVGARANSAFGQANLAFDKANSSSGIAASAFGQANLAFDKANSSSGIAASAFGQANLAFATANTANSTLNASNLSSGTVPSARLSGSYTSITGVGTLTTGSIPGSLVSSAVSNATTATNGAKAWANWTVLAIPVTVEASYNISSITYVSQGLFTITFTTPLVDDKYALAGSSTTNAVVNGWLMAQAAYSGATAKSNTSFQVLNYNPNTGATNPFEASIIVFR